MGVFYNTFSLEAEVYYNNSCERQNRKELEKGLEGGI